MAHLHFLQEEEKRVLAPYSCGVLQDQMLVGSRLGTLCARAGGGMDALGMDAVGMDEVGRLLPAPSQLIPTRDPIRVSRAGKRVCCHGWCFTFCPLVP